MLLLGLLGLNLLLAATHRVLTVCAEARQDDDARSSASHRRCSRLLALRYAPIIHCISLVVSPMLYVGWPLSFLSPPLYVDWHSLCVSLVICL